VGGNGRALRLALDVSLDELLRPPPGRRRAAARPSRKVLRRLELMESHTSSRLCSKASI